MSEKKRLEVLAFKRGLEAGQIRLPQNANAWMRIEQKRIINVLREEYERGGSEMGIIPYLIDQIERKN